MPSNVEELDGGVIRFNRVTGTNEQGQYVCTAENDVGTITGVATLTIQSIPVVSVTPSGSPIKAKVGQRLRLECRAQGDPAPSVSWRRLRTGFLYDAIDASNKETQQVAVYDINRVTQADEGTYSCTARNEAGLTEERLQIIVEPSSNRGDIEENENEIDGSDGGGGGRDGSSNTAGGNLMGGDDVFRVPVGGTAEMRCILQGINVHLHTFNLHCRRACWNNLDGRGWSMHAAHLWNSPACIDRTSPSPFLILV